MMRALVTGGGGFVGAHLYEHLTACGDDVTLTDRSTGGPDIVDPAAIAAVVGATRPEIIYHLAGQADVAASWDDPADTMRANAEGTVNVLAAASRHGVERVLVVSSAEVYGPVLPTDLPVKESAPLNPASPYAASKASAEMAAVQWSNAGLGVVIARSFNHLGPGQSERFVAPAIAARILRAQTAGQASIAVGNLSARRDFTDVRDVVRAYRLLARRGLSGQAYNVCSGADRSIADLIDMILERTGHSVSLEADPDLQRPSDLSVLRGDPAKLHAQTGWTPEIPLETTINDLIVELSDRQTDN